MESDFERDAKRAVVDAVEARFAHNEAVRKRAAIRRGISSIGSVIAGLAVLTGIVLWFRGSGGTAGFGSLIGKARDMISGGGSVAELGGVMAGDSEISNGNDSERIARERYAGVAQEFLKGTLKSWKNVPVSIKPKGAASGAVYRVLVPRKVGFVIYEMTKRTDGGMDIFELSPFGASLKVEVSTFKRECSGKRYFIAHCESVYASGSDNLKQMDALRHKLLKTKEDSTEDMLP